MFAPLAVRGAADAPTQIEALFTKTIGKAFTVTVAMAESLQPVATSVPVTI